MSANRASIPKKKTGTTTVRNYLPRTLKLLWGRSAGHCAMPDCRIELFAEATDYDPVVVIGEMGHVAGASDDGPRAKPGMSVPDRNDYRNLILLCQNCHGKVDGQPGFYTEERLHDIKDAHEAWVRASLPERGRSKTGWAAFALEGDHPLDLGTADAAVSPDFVVGEPIRLSVPTSPDNWQMCDRKIASAAVTILSGGDKFEKRVAIFPLAPVSACLSLGFHLTSRPHVRHFQLHRNENSWAWPARQAPVQDIEVLGADSFSAEAAEVAFLFHFSATITDAAIADVLPAAVAKVHLRVPAPNTGWLVAPEQIIWAAATARASFETAILAFPKARLWHFFYAGPAPLAVAIGQQINPTMYPAVQLYEFRYRESPPYKPSMRLGV